MILRALALRALTAAFCLGALEAVLLYRLQYVQRYPFVHLEILNVGLAYAATVGLGLWGMGAIGRRLRAAPAFASAAAIALVPVVLAFRYQKYLRSVTGDAEPLGIVGRLLGIAVAASATILLGWLFRRRPAVGSAATGVLVTVTIVVLAYNAAVPPGARGASVRIREESRNPVNVIWVTSDALRSASMSVHGYARETTPVLEAFREDAVFFRRNYAQCCWTQPTMTSLFTSLYPFESFRMEGGLSPELITVAQVLREAGWRTAGLSNNEVVGPSTNLDRGFEAFYRPPRVYAKDRILSYTTLVYLVDGFVGWRISNAVEAVTLVPQPRRELPARTEKALYEQGVRLLDELAEPFFLYLHFMAPHAPYAPEEPWVDWGGATLPPTGHLLEDARRMPPKGLADEEVAEIVWRYDREIRMLDAYFGRLLDELRERDLYDDAIIVFTSDHGEEFLEHGEWTHGRALYEESVHVPFLIKLPNGRHGGRTFDLPTQSVDVLPTLLELIELEATFPYPLRGDPLFGDGGATIRDDLGHRPIVLEFDSHYPDIGDQTAIVLGDWKLIRHLADGRYELYDLAADPAERRDLANVGEELRGRLAGLLDEVIRDHEDGFYTGAPSPLEARRVQDELRALGYIQ